MQVDDKLAKEKLARILDEYADEHSISCVDLTRAHQLSEAKSDAAIELAQLIRNTDLTDCQQVSLAEIPACDCYCSPHLRNCATQVAAPDQGSVRNATDMLPWWRDRFDDIVSDANVLLANIECPESMRPGLMGIKAVAEQQRDSLAVHAIRALPVLEDE